MQAFISDIKRFSVHDGDGIRTTVFFKGCSLKCVWCHNPESIRKQPQMAYFKEQCVDCGECATVCKNGAHELKNGVHSFEFNKCTLCGKCEKVCLGEAMKIYGKAYSVDELLEEILKDESYFKDSNGGVTLSGGECLLQADFCYELMKKLKQHNIHIAIDTCGFVDKKAIEKIAEFTDLFLYDIKAIDSETHVKCTGASNEVIIENLRYIDTLNIPIYIRIPYVPKYNADEIDKIAEFVKEFKNIDRVEVLPYHNYAASRYKALNMVNTLPKILPTSEEISTVSSKF